MLNHQLDPEADSQRLSAIPRNRSLVNVYPAAGLTAHCEHGQGQLPLLAEIRAYVRHNPSRIHINDGAARPGMRIDIFAAYSVAENISDNLKRHNVFARARQRFSQSCLWLCASCSHRRARNFAHGTRRQPFHPPSSANRTTASPIGRAARHGPHRKYRCA